MKNKFNKFLKINQATGQNFTVTYSNYTQKIEGPYPYYYYEKETPLKAFSLHSVIKKDLKGIQPPTGANPRLFKNRLPDLLEREDLLCVDLNSAYFQAALNLGYISEETFLKGQQAKKDARLISLGMLASTKTKIMYQGTEPINYQVQENPLKPFFLSVMHQVGEIMEAASIEFKNSFLFYWFDGIYFENGQDATEVMEFFYNNGPFPSKAEHLKKFICRKSKNYHLVKYEKNEKLKRFFIPEISAPEIDQIINNDLKKLINQKNGTF